MAASYKAGTITSPTSTGNLGFTGIGFQPKVLLLFFEKQTAAGNGVDYLRGHGFATSSSSERAISAVFLDTGIGGIVNMARAQSNANCLYAFNTTAVSASAFLVADFVSFDADGFTLNFSTVQASGYLIEYVALGGADLTNVAIKDVQSPGSTGNVAYTGVGFQPDALITITNSDTSAGPGSSHNAGARVGIGFVTAGASKATHSVGDDNSGKKYARAQRTGVTMALDVVTPSLLFEATHVSMDSDGFTWNWNTVSANRYTFVLCLKGGQYKVGVFNQATGTGNQAVTGVGFTSLGTMLASVNAVATTSINTGAKHSLGAADSSSSRFALWLGATGDPAVVDHTVDSSNVIRMLTEGTPTDVTTADYVSNDADGFTINNTTVDATSREVVYFSFGNSAVAATNRLLMMLGVGI